MYWIVVVIILAVAVWLGWEIKNAPLMEECSFCGEVCSPHKIKYLKKEKFFFLRRLSALRGRGGKRRVGGIGVAWILYGFCRCLARGTFFISTKYFREI